MSSFSDLRTRLASGLVMAVIGLGAIWLGGMAFGALALALAGLMGWELHRMLDPGAPEGRGGATGVVAVMLVTVFTFYQSGWIALAGMALGAAVMAWRMPRDKLVFGLYLTLILWAAHSLIVFRGSYGLIFVLWIVLIVIASDVAGYFAGRVFGGPKFWPRFSPKKTWSGTVAGWLLAALVGVGFMARFDLSWGLIPISALLAFAGQLGDIAESAIKRHVGVKDSSKLIPGHGGVLDRFDAMIAVAALALILAYLGAFGGAQV
ncbi:phosphatidate cytidylyltransferase [Pararhodobacter marinus]|uniref:Phosphatidate cytidylyltransferase n=1 Tax=Pararhodobacter marinus TaxID=2184063 RepID=A0A2U2CBE9_9RHOB|nr:phosphatidate cytidylyltransferase [Pararhodobacter marinus]PWE29190.1 phosphatidate cytidylyltransferase [Pararhodobacter marinus]